MRRILLAISTISLALAVATVAEELISVSILRPDPHVAAIGRIVVEASVYSPEPIERVEFYLDGSRIGEAGEPPYEVELDLGESLGAHRFDVVAYGESGATGKASLVTPPLAVDDQVSVRLHQLYVTVTDGEGDRVLDLGLEEFEVLDERRSQEIITFATGEIPFTAAVLVDASVSMKGRKLEAALEGARTFFQGMRPLDVGRLLVVSDRLLHGTPFTTFPDVLAAGLGRVQARGGTALNDHLYLALKQLEDRQGRRLVLLLSDGVDSHSVLSMAEVEDVSRRAQVLIYWLRLPFSDDHTLPPRISTPWRDAEGYERELERLERTVLESGGRIQQLQSAVDLNQAFQSILEELRDQYALGYYPDSPRHDGSWRRVEVRVRRSGLEQRSRSGYLDE